MSEQEYRPSLAKEVRDLAMDVLQAGWMRYGHLADGAQIRCVWRQEGGQRWLEVEHLGTGHKALFSLLVEVEQVTLPPIGPEDDGALQAELRDAAAAAGEDKPWAPGGVYCATCDHGGHTCPGCGASVPHEGSGVCPACTVEHGPKPAGERSRTWDPDNPGCAPEECGGSRLDPCSTVMRTRGARHDGEPAPAAEEPTTWGRVAAGDQAKGDDGSWYPVVSVREGRGPQEGRTVVTLRIANQGRPYPMDPEGPVTVIRGAIGAKVSMLADAFPGSTVIES